MAWIVAIIVGAIIGFLASLIMNWPSSLLADVIVGIIGAILGRWLFFSVLGIGSAGVAGTFSFYGIFWGVIGALILIVILRGLRLYV